MSAYVTHLLVVLSLFNTFTWLVHKLEIQVQFGT